MSVQQNGPGGDTSGRETARGNFAADDIEIMALVEPFAGNEVSRSVAAKTPVQDGNGSHSTGRRRRADLGGRRVSLGLPPLGSVGLLHGASAPPNPQGSQGAKAKRGPPPTPCTVGTITSVKGHYALIPVGAIDCRPPLPMYGLDAYRACWLDLCRRLYALACRGDGLEYLPLRSIDTKKRYGNPRLAQGRPWVWDVVRRHLLGQWTAEERVELERCGAPTSPIVECDGDFTIGQKSLGYRLVEEWREREGVRLRVGDKLYMRRAKLGTPTRSDGTALSYDPWLDHCLTDLLTFDLEAALRDILSYAGAMPPDDLGDHAALHAAISAGTPTRQVLADARRWRKQGDLRTPLEIVRAQARAQVTHLFSWRVDNLDDPWEPGRDPAGHRLHTPITNLAEYIRAHIRLAGEDVVCIDAVNSQLVFLADMAVRALGTSDAHEFAKMCGEGWFYEVAFHAVEGRDPKPEERSRFKPALMGAWLFVDAGVQAGSKHGQALSKLWPSVHRWMLQKKAGGTRYLPCECQKLEAAVWIDTIVPRLAALKVPCTPIHDCVLVPASRAEEARKVIEAVYQEKGLRAKFKVAPLVRSTFECDSEEGEEEVDESAVTIESIRAALHRELAKLRADEEGEVTAVELDGPSFDLREDGRTIVRWWPRSGKTLAPAIGGKGMVPANRHRTVRALVGAVRRGYYRL